MHGWGRDGRCARHQVMANTAGLLRAKSAMREVGWLERTMEGADAAPCLLERLSEAMLQSFYDRFGGLSKLTKGWTGCIWQTGVDGCAPEPRCLK